MVDDFSTDSFHSQDSFHTDFDLGPTELIRPSRLVLPICLLSVTAGLILGAVGLASYFGGLFNLSSVLLQAIGISGGFLCLVLPMTLTILAERRHQQLCRDIRSLQEEGKSYDAYAGEILRRRLSQVLVLAFIAAAAPIVVAAIPLGEKFAA